MKKHLRVLGKLTCVIGAPQVAGLAKAIGEIRRVAALTDSMLERSFALTTGLLVCLVTYTAY